MTVKSLLLGHPSFCPSSQRPPAPARYLYKERVLGVAVPRPTLALSPHLFLSFLHAVSFLLTRQGWLELPSQISNIAMEVGRELGAAGCCALTVGLPWDALAQS